MTKRTRLVAWTGLGLLVGSAPLISLSSEPARAAPGSCSTPSAAKCLEPGYLDSPCASQFVDVCGPVVQDALGKHHKSSRAKQRPMLRDGGAVMPADVTTGRFYPYKGPTRKAAKNPKFTKSPSEAKKAIKHPGNNAMASQRYGGPATGSGPKLDRHRNPKWAANGTRVTSCDEFAYESLHDWSRFIDVAQTCRGDAECITEVGLGTAVPGLDHAMRDTAGRKIKGHRLEKKVLPKNEFFRFADKFAFASGPDGFSPANPQKWETMAAHLRHGHEFHRIGIKPPKKTRAKKGKAKLGKATPPLVIPTAGKVKYYSDEFGFHRRLRERTKKVSANERAEFARRRKLINELMELWVANGQRVKESMLEGIAQHNIQPEVEIPFLTDPSDPFVKLAGSVQQHKALSRSARKAIKKMGPSKLQKMPGAGVVNKLVPRKKPQVGARSLDEIDADLEALGLFAAPGRQKKRGKQTRRQRRKSKREAEKLRRRKGSKQRGSKKKVGTPKMLSAAQEEKLKPAQFVGSHVPELAAMQECLAWPLGGKPGAKESLAELAGYGPISCRIGALLRFEWERKLAGHASCLDLADPGCDWSPEMFTERFAENLPYLEDYAEIRNDCNDWTADRFGRADVSLPVVEDRIKKVKAKAAEALGELEPYMQGKPGEHGQAFGFEWGDKETWGDKDLFAAGYSAGLGWLVEPTNSVNGEVCALEGHAEASFGVSGYFFGKEAKVVDALGRVEAKDGSGELDAHVVALGYHVFDEKKNFNLSKAWEADGGKSIDVPKPKPSVTIPAGPIIITGSAWGELYFGAQMRAAAKANQCSAGSLFHAEASFGPTARVTAAAQVGFGVSGFVSAGIRGYLDLITLGLPLGLEAKMAAGSLVIGGGLDLLLGTLSGRLALYVEYIIGESEYDIIKWAGLGPEEFELFQLPQVSLPLVAM